MNVKPVGMHRIPAPAKPDSGQFYKSGSIATGFGTDFSDGDFPICIQSQLALTSRLLLFRVQIVFFFFSK
jgi:hypothetical protein